MTDEQPKATYHARAIHDEATPAGRFAKATATVNGTSPTVPALAVPIWSQGPQPGDEPPLGYAVDDMEPG
jgi:hypothetical protein